MVPNGLPSSLDDNDLPHASLSACWWIPLPDPIGLKDGGEFHFRVLKSQSELSKLHSDAPSKLSPVKYDITFQIRQLDVPWEPSPGELAAFQLAKSGQEQSDERNSTTEAQNSGEKSMRRLSIIQASVLLVGQTEITTEELSDAFDAALTQLRKLQSSYSLVSQGPMIFATRETLPISIPFETLQTSEDGSIDRNLGIYLLHIHGAQQLVTPEALSDGEEEKLHLAIDRHYAAFFSYHRLRHDAAVSLKRRGDYRASLLSVASACEVFLDDLLLHMMWEEGVRPEVAGQTFADPRVGIMKRLKSQYVGRLHGIWNPHHSGPTQLWRENVALVRNRVIHAGYEPGIEEAQKAYDTLIALERHGADLAAARSTKYPRTALAICGAEGLDRRGKFTQRIRRLMQDSTEPDWPNTFIRWKSEALRERDSSEGLAEEPQLARASLEIISNTEGVDWVLHDTVAGMAARVAPNPEILSKDQGKAVSQILQSSAIGVFTIVGASGFVPSEPWVGQHRRVPGFGTMVDKADMY